MSVVQASASSRDLTSSIKIPREPSERSLDEMVLAFQRSGETKLPANLYLAALPLVRKAVERIHRRLPHHVDQDDLIQEATFGLLHAVGSFDPKKSASFATYASHKIGWAVMDYIRSIDWAPRLSRSRAKLVDEARRRFYALNGRFPTEPELASQLKMSQALTDRVCKDARTVGVTSIDSYANKSETPLSEVLDATGQSDPSQTSIRRDLREYVTRFLTQQERIIIILYYYERMSMKEIGVTLGISESRVSQLHKLIIKRLRARKREVAAELKSPV